MSPMWRAPGELAGPDRFDVDRHDAVILAAPDGRSVGCTAQSRVPGMILVAPPTPAAGRRKSGAGIRRSPGTSGGIPTTKGGAGFARPRYSAVNTEKGQFR